MRIVQLVLSPIKLDLHVLNAMQEHFLLQDLRVAPTVEPVTIQLAGLVYVFLVKQVPFPTSLTPQPAATARQEPINLQLAKHNAYPAKPVPSQNRRLLSVRTVLRETRQTHRLLVVSYAVLERHQIRLETVLTVPPEPSLMRVMHHVPIARLTLFLQLTELPLVRTVDPENNLHLDQPIAHNALKESFQLDQQLLV